MISTTCVTYLEALTSVEPTHTWMGSFVKSRAMPADEGDGEFIRLGDLEVRGYNRSGTRARQ